MEYVEIVLDLFVALADLFQNQCLSQGIVIYDENNNYTHTFEKWCRKLYQAGITRADMRRGMEHLEEAKRDSVRTGNEVWPPDFASFIGHCREQKEREFWAGLPKPKMNDEQRKEKMKQLKCDLDSTHLTSEEAKEALEKLQKGR